MLRLNIPASSEGRPVRPGNLVGINNGKIKGKAWFDPRLGLVIASSDGDSMDLSLAEGGKILTPHLTQQTETTLLGRLSRRPITLKSLTR